MKNIHWKAVMFAAVIAMLVGMCISLWGIDHGNVKATWIGFATIIIVCVSWWFWVMFVIRTMINHTSQTQQGLGEIKQGIREVRGMVRDLDFNNKR
jgi:hypothetical protein